MEEEWKSTPSLEMGKVAKTATGLNSYGVGNHALNLMAVPSSKQPMIWLDYVCKADRKDNCKIFEHKSVKLSRAQAPAIPKILLILVKLAPCIPPVFRSQWRRHFRLCTHWRIAKHLSFTETGYLGVAGYKLQGGQIGFL